MQIRSAYAAGFVYKQTNLQNALNISGRTPPKMGASERVLGEVRPKSVLTLLTNHDIIVNRKRTNYERTRYGIVLFRLTLNVAYEFTRAMGIETSFPFRFDQELLSEYARATGIESYIFYLCLPFRVRSRPRYGY